MHLGLKRKEEKKKKRRKLDYRELFRLSGENSSKNEFKFFQKSSFFLYKSWFSTISLNIHKNIKIPDILMKYTIFDIKI